MFNFLPAVTDTVDLSFNLYTVLDSSVHPMEYWLGPSHAHDADTHIFEPHVRLESAKGFIIEQY